MKPVAISICALVTLTGCSRNTPADSGQFAQEISPGSTTGSSAGTLPGGTSTRGNSGDSLEPSFTELRSSIPADVGVAIADANGVRAFGSWIEGPAWSTIKIPLSIAALRHSAEQASVLVPLAIRDSDNPAAEELWAQLGEPSEAAQAVAAVLKEGGDSSTVVQSVRTRKEFTAFGQTTWSVDNQASFTKVLPCLSGSGPVLTDMRQLADNQRWGLAVRPGVAAKGGWGPSPEGAYLVRQIATITARQGQIGVALSALPNDGKFESGKVHVEKLAEWFEQNLGRFSPQKCPP